MFFSQVIFQFVQFTVSWSIQSTLSSPSLPRIRCPVWNGYCVCWPWLLSYIISSPFALAQATAVSYGSMGCSLTKKLPLQVRVQSGVYIFPHNSHSRWTSYSLPLNSYSLFGIHLKYHLISEAYTKVILVFLKYYLCIVKIITSHYNY